MSNILGRTALTHNSMPGKFTEVVQHDFITMGMQPCNVDGKCSRYFPKPDDDRFPYLLSFIEAEDSPRRTTEVYLNYRGMDHLLCWLIGFASDKLLDKAEKLIHEMRDFRKDVRKSGATNIPYYWNKGK